MTTKGYTFLAFVLGGVVGAGVALLFAPASGEVTRKRIKDGVSDATDKVTAKYGDVKEAIAEGAGKVKQMFEDKKEELKAVYEAGRETYVKGK